MKPFKKSPVHIRQYGDFDDSEIRSHSSLLSNERLAILFYTLDYTSINLNSSYKPEGLSKTKSILYQIYKNIRSLIRSDTLCRIVMNLETEERGVYTLDIAFELVNKMIQYSQLNGFTFKRCYIIAKHLNHIEIILRDIMQFFKYFYRTAGKQKPDIFAASEEYKDMADKLTVDELKDLVGKRHSIDFERLESGIDKKLSMDVFDKKEEEEEISEVYEDEKIERKNEVYEDEKIERKNEVYEDEKIERKNEVYEDEKIERKNEVYEDEKIERKNKVYEDEKIESENKVYEDEKIEQKSEVCEEDEKIKVYEDEKIEPKTKIYEDEKIEPKTKIYEDEKIEH